MKVISPCAEYPIYGTCTGITNRYILTVFTNVYADYSKENSENIRFDNKLYIAISLNNCFVK